MPVSFFAPEKTYVFFSHTTKGQQHNMSMLKRMMDLKCNLIDYEKITNDIGKRIVYFGRYAGLAGMIETLWALGRRLHWEQGENPLARIKHAYEYPDLETAKEDIKAAGEDIAENGVPPDLAPFIVGFAGYGSSSQGAQEILDLLPVREIEPGQLERIASTAGDDTYHVYKVIFRVRDMVAPLSPDAKFKVQTYHQHPESYRSKFDDYLPHLTALMNCIYWEEHYLRLVTKESLRKLSSRTVAPRLRAIGDITCDIEGAIECTVRATTPDDPVFLYDPLQGTFRTGFEGAGLMIMAVDNLPCEFPQESSVAFSQAVKDYIAVLAGTDLSVPFDALALPPSLKRAMVLHHGELTPNFRYMERWL